MNKEIEIPKGYEARIEGNKVVFISKESEDERIRKYLIWVVKNVFNNIAQLKLSEEQTRELINNFSGIKVSDILAWLEKQKEQKPISVEEEKDFLEKEVKAFLCNYDKEFDDDAPAYDIAEHFYQLGKNSQEPAKWNDSVAKELFIKALERAVEQTKKGYELTDCDKHYWWEDFKVASQQEKPKMAPFRDIIAWLEAQSEEEMLNHPFFLQGFDMGRDVERAFQKVVG